MNQTWHVGRPRPWPNSVRWGPSSPHPKGHSPQFSAHICCCQMPAWIKMSLGMDVGLDTGDFVLDGDPDPPPQRGGGAPSPIFGPCTLWSNGWMHQDGTWHASGPWSMPHCARRGPKLPFPKRGRSHFPQFSAHFCCGQTAGCIKMPLGMEVGLSPRTLCYMGT